VEFQSEQGRVRRTDGRGFCQAADMDPASEHRSIGGCAQNFGISATEGYSCHGKVSGQWQHRVVMALVAESLDSELHRGKKAVMLVDADCRSPDSPSDWMEREFCFRGREDAVIGLLIG